MKITLLNKLIDFLKSSKQELARVTWPSKAYAIKLTLMVILTILISAAIVGLIDLFFTKSFEYFLLKIK